MARSIRKSKNSFQKFIVLATAIFWLIVATTFAYSQPSPSPGNSLPEYPVLLGNETLFSIQARSGSFSAQERAQIISKRIEKIAQDPSIAIDSVKVDEQDGGSNITFGDSIIVTITEEDGKLADLSRGVLAREYAQKIRDSLDQYRKDRDLKNILLDVLYTVIATLLLGIFFKFLNYSFPKFCTMIESWRGTLIPSLRIQNLELLSAAQITKIILGIARFIRLIFILIVLYIYIPLVLSFFPWTRPFSSQLFNYLFAGIEAVIKGFFAYLPNLFIIAIIGFFTYYILRFVKFFFNALERGNISFSWFYPEWATPTYRLSLFLIIALAIAIAFPYLPGFDSPAFRGVSIFLGILVSLGSTAAVANVVAGIILIYTRAFEVGDRVQIADATGDIVEKSLLVTRIRSIKNVVITIPNSMVVSNQIINFSSLALMPDTSLILHTTITLGYDIPWRKVHATLIEAAQATEHILDNPVPFVWQTSLDDFYVSYELNAYTNQPTLMAKIYGELHQNIQDKCNEVGIEIMSPHYSAMRDGNQNTIPEDYLPKDYTAPGFRISPLSNQFNLTNQLQSPES
jgi:small-conductance mechanosensitive channel